jgi:hypothetical protein
MKCDPGGMMDESQILKRLQAVGAEITAGQPPHFVFDSIVEAVHALGFDRVRLDLSLRMELLSRRWLRVASGG